MKAIGKLLSDVYIDLPLSGIFTQYLLPFFLAAYIFIGGLPYGIQPIDVKLTYEITSAQEVYTEGDTLSVNLYAENVGRPFYGQSFGALSAVLHRIDPDKEQHFPIIFPDSPEVIADALPVKILVKHGDTAQGSATFTLGRNDPGLYSLRVQYRAYDGETVVKIFENAVEIR